LKFRLTNNGTIQEHALTTRNKHNEQNILGVHTSTSNLEHQLFLYIKQIHHKQFRSNTQRNKPRFYRQNQITVFSILLHLEMSNNRPSNIILSSLFFDNFLLTFTICFSSFRHLASPCFYIFTNIIYSHGQSFLHHRDHMTFLKAY
jgi:hypothetical protein